MWKGTKRLLNPAKHGIDLAEGADASDRSIRLRVRPSATGRARIALIVSLKGETIAVAAPELVAAIRRQRENPEPTEDPVWLRLARDVLAAFRDSGSRWQSRLDDVLKRAIAEGALEADPRGPDRPKARSAEPAAGAGRAAGHGPARGRGRARASRALRPRPGGSTSWVVPLMLGTVR